MEKEILELMLLVVTIVERSLLAAVCFAYIIDHWASYKLKFTKIKKRIFK